MTTTGYMIIVIIAVLATGMVLFYRHRTKRTLLKLNQMLDAAIQGSFTEECFDESMLSALETKLAHYLAASTVSAHNLQMEKDNIKTLIADISHQTKTPIANVVLYTQLLGEQKLSPESRACVTALEGQAEKLQALIEALVKTSRLESGVISLHPITGKLDSVIHSAALQLAPKAEAKGIQIIMEEIQATALFDPKWTEEAIFNLLDNAVKYTPSGGQIHINTTAYQLFACIHIADTGAGIPEQEQPKIFQRFYRGTSHQTEEGVGIGLYLVRQIAEGQGGYVKVSSHKGKGSVFSLYLPRS